MITLNIDLDLSNQTAQFLEEISEEEEMTVNELIASFLEDIARFNRPSMELEKKLLENEQDTEDLRYRLEKGEKI